MLIATVYVPIWFYHISFSLSAELIGAKGYSFCQLKSKLEVDIIDSLICNLRAN
jgi:hypothetical protein